MAVTLEPGPPESRNSEGVSGRLQVETPANSNHQTALLGRVSDAGGPDLPAEGQGREDGNSGNPSKEEDWEGLEGIALRPEEEGQNEEGEGGPGPP